MTRGGARKDAGRPKSKDETKTANLCGVRVTPSQVAAYKATAGLRNVPYSAWVTNRLDTGVAPEVLAAMSANGPSLADRKRALDWKGPKKRKRKKP